jgi:hypothetical protein
MKIALYLTVLVATVALFSCKKEDDINPEYVKKADEFKSLVGAKYFQIRQYYSNEPIDYIEDDGIAKSETDLNQYISEWLKDDYNMIDLNNNTVTITQNTVKIDTVPAMPDSFSKSISIGADKTGPYFNFLNYQYQPLKYYISEMGSNYFVIYANWHSGAKVFTRFELINP